MSDETGGSLLAVRRIAELERLLEAQRAARAGAASAADWYDDPLGFIDNCIKFPEPRRQGTVKRVPGLAPYQREIIGSIPGLKRVAVRGPRGLGKTTLAALVVLWFSLTREMAGVDHKVITTAGSWSQLTFYTWPEIRKWAYHIDWERVGRPPFSERTELMKTGLSLRHGLATAASPDQPEKVEGGHADSILALVDEAKIVSADTFDAIEGMFSGADEDSGLEAYAVCISTPGPPSGRFYDIHRHAPGLEDWHTRHVTLDEAVSAGRMSSGWARQRAKLWGVNSALYKNHVEGEFCADDEDAVIPLAWVEAAQERWREWQAEGSPDQDGQHVIGVDVARSGQDKSVAAFRHGDVVTRLVVWAKEDTMGTTGRVKGFLEADPSARAQIDVIGIGAGVFDRCREQGLKVEPFHAGKKTARKDKTGQFGFFNVRSAAWWFLREQLEPPESMLAIPPDDELAGDLTALHYTFTSDGKIRIESKDDARSRIGRSTDRGDAVMQACWNTAGSFLEVYGLVKCPDEACGRVFAADAGGKPRVHCPYCRVSLEETAGG